MTEDEAVGLCSGLTQQEPPVICVHKDGTHLDQLEHETTVLRFSSASVVLYQSSYGPRISVVSTFPTSWSFPLEATVNRPPACSFLQGWHMQNSERRGGCSQGCVILIRPE